MNQRPLLFCLSSKHNRSLLAKKSTLLMNEKKKDPPFKEKVVNCVSHKAKDEKKRSIITKTNNGRKFRYT